MWPERLSRPAPIRRCLLTGSPYRVQALEFADGRQRVQPLTDRSRGHLSFVNRIDADSRPQSASGGPGVPESTIAGLWGLSLKVAMAVSMKPREADLRPVAALERCSVLAGRGATQRAPCATWHDGVVGPHDQRHRARIRSWSLEQTAYIV